MTRFWTDLWKSRTLVRQLVLTKVRASTARMLLGWVWWILDPLLMMMIYWGVVFGIRGGTGLENEPFPMFLLSSLLVWKHISSSAGRSVSVYPSQANIILSVPFPIATLPIVEVVSGLVPFVCGVAVYSCFSLWAGVAQDFGTYWSYVQVAPLILIQLALCIGLAAALAVFGCLVRDIGGVVQHALQAAYFLSPGLYSLATVEERMGQSFFTVYKVLNPAAPLMGSYRDALFRGQWIDSSVWSLMIAQALASLFIGTSIHNWGKNRVARAL